MEKRIRSKRISTFDRTFKLFTTLIATIGMAIAVTIQIYKTWPDFTDEQSKHEEQLSVKLAEIEDIIDELYLRNNTHLNIQQDSVSIASTDLRNSIVLLTNKVDRLDNQFLGLRQALNPLNPNEILTIARLKDEVGLIVEKQGALKDDTERRMEEFKSSVVRELEATSKSTNWLFVVLVPLVLNLLYSIWKDRRDSKANDQQAT